MPKFLNLRNGVAIAICLAGIVMFSGCEDNDEAKKPSAVTNFVATAGNAQVSLSWAAPLDNGGAAITGYEVTMNNWASTITRLSNETAYTFTGLTNDTEYTFKVRARNANGVVGEESERKAAPTNANTNLWVMINGVKWAICNVDARGTFTTSPELSGMIYQWNRPTAWASEGEVSGWNSTMPAGTTWLPENDPSPNGWRVPTLEEIQKLLDTDKVDISEFIGWRRFTDKATGNSIIIPQPPYNREGDGSICRFLDVAKYWSNTQSDDADGVRCLYVRDKYVGFSYKNQGHYIRPVLK